MLTETCSHHAVERRKERPIPSHGDLKKKRTEMKACGFRGKGKMSICCCSYFFKVDLRYSLYFALVEEDEKYCLSPFLFLMALLSLSSYTNRGEWKRDFHLTDSSWPQDKWQHS